jgi:hypothetical protein
MISITEGKWIADLGAMTCRNIENRVVVAFRRKGEAVEGQIKDMPFELLEKLAELPDGPDRIRQTVEEAEEVFQRALIESKIERADSQKY